MLDIYQATPEERALMLALTAETRNGKRKGWWHDYTETALPEWFPEDPRTGELLEPPLTYLDTVTAGMYLQKPDEVEAYRRAWDDLRKKALDTEASKNMITEAMEGYTNG
jgi:hypothetical protein